MATATMTSWKPGMDLPYVMSLGQGRMLAISLQAAWLKSDRSGQPLLLPPAIRALDRLRAVFADSEKVTPGFIMSLRQGMDLTQVELGDKLGVSKMTVSRWECGRMRPGRAAVQRFLKLQVQARGVGLVVDCNKRPAHGYQRNIPSRNRL